LKVQESINRLF